MKCKFVTGTGLFPNLRYGPSGEELRCLIPDGIVWQQLNYGQGEGQVSINGSEWGFYFPAEDSMLIVFHKGHMEFSTAISFIKSVHKKLSDTYNVDLRIEILGQDDH